MDALCRCSVALVILGSDGVLLAEPQARGRPTGATVAVPTSGSHSAAFHHTLLFWQIWVMTKPPPGSVGPRQPKLSVGPVTHEKHREIALLWIPRLTLPPDPVQGQQAKGAPACGPEPRAPAPCRAASGPPRGART